MKSKIPTGLWLFGVNLAISAFTFGGGYAVMPMIRKYYVQKRKAFTEEELMDLAAVAQSSPGAIAINLAALAGYRVAGGKGVLAACLGSVIPPFIILSAISAFYGFFCDNAVLAAVLRGMEAGVCALIVDVVWDMGKVVLHGRNILHMLLVPISFAAVFLFQANVIAVIGCSAIVCVLDGWIRRRRMRDEDVV